MDEYWRRVIIENSKGIDPRTLGNPKRSNRSPSFFPGVIIIIGFDEENRRLENVKRKNITINLRTTYRYSIQ